MPEREEALDVFHAEYDRIFPQGGDAADHEEAMHSAVAAVIGDADAEIARLRDALTQIMLASNGEIHHPEKIRDIARLALARTDQEEKGDG